MPIRFPAPEIVPLKHKATLKKNESNKVNPKVIENNENFHDTREGSLSNVLSIYKVYLPIFGLNYFDSSFRND